MRLRVILGLVLMSAMLSAQSFEEQYMAFQQSAKQNYNDFRDAANESYASFLRSSWERFKAKPAVKTPEEKPVPPVVYEVPENDPEPQPIPFDDVAPVPVPDDQPEPIAPVVENNESSITVAISFYGTDLGFRHPSIHRLNIKSLSGEALSEAWKTLAGQQYDNLLYDCLKARDEHKLCDWAYCQMLQFLSEKIYGKGNEAVLLMAFLYSQSGYAMRLAMSSDGEHLYLLVGSQYRIYDRGYYEIDNLCYYPLDDVKGDLIICNGYFDHEQAMSLSFGYDQILVNDGYSISPRQSTAGLSVSCKINRNLISFYNEYPSGQIGDEFWTRWMVYANAPMEEGACASLYPSLMTAVRGVPEKRAVSLLLNWVQTAFEYQYDDSIWGGDRAFFPLETLHYPYADCEDRAILFSRIVRDLLGLDVALIYYPGHLATAVCFNQDVSGDYVMMGNKRYIICDPTYIGAPIGKTMPGMDNVKAKVIPLKK